MRMYYEAIENVDMMKASPEFIRIDITDMTKVEKDEVLTDIKSIMSGKDYRLVYHQCGHDEGERCIMKDI